MSKLSLGSESLVLWSLSRKGYLLIQIKLCETVQAADHQSNHEITTSSFSSICVYRALNCFIHHTSLPNTQVFISERVYTAALNSLFNNFNNDYTHFRDPDQVLETNNSKKHSKADSSFQTFDITHTQWL